MKPDWDILLDEQALASVLPPAYSRFVSPIRRALTVFLNGLSAPRQTQILRLQAQLPSDATFSDRIGRLAQCCPVLHKLGQVLARDRRLAAELRESLAELESLPPSVPLESIQEILNQELGPLEEREIELTPPALAEASVAVVIPFTQHTNHQIIHGVFKVLKPDIEHHMEEELDLLEHVGDDLDARCDELQLPHLDYRESFQQVRHKLKDEVLLENEQRHLRQAREFYSGQAEVHVPQLLDHCSARVTAMERLSGGKVTAHGLITAKAKQRLAALVARTMIARTVFSPADEALFHGDPHAGNLFLTEEGRLGLLDWSLTGTLSKRERAVIMQVMLGAIMLDSRKIVTGLESLADPDKLNHQVLGSVVDAWLTRIRQGQFPGLGWLIGLLDDAVQQARMRVSVDLMLFRKSLHTLEGVLADVGERSGQIDKTLCLEFLKHFAVEWPRRWYHAPHSRDYATQLSNLDLAQLWLNYPTTVARFWTAQAADFMDYCKNRLPRSAPDTQPVERAATITSSDS